MAGDWIKLQHATPDKPEVHAISAELGISPEEVLGRLIRVWLWVDQQSLNGNALSVTVVTLDAIARRDGFAQSMQKAGWLSIERGCISFPNFDRHNGKTAKARALTAERAVTHRQRKSNDARVTKALPEKRSKEVREKPAATPVLEPKSPPVGGQDSPPSDPGPVWGECLSIVQGWGMTETGARGFLGLLCRDHEERVVADAVMASMGKADPKGYVRAVLRDKPKKSALEDPQNLRVVV